MLLQCQFSTQYNVNLVFLNKFTIMIQKKQTFYFTDLLFMNMLFHQKVEQRV